MAYIEGFVAAVPKANREKYEQHVQETSDYFKKLGVSRCVENWGVTCRKAR